jgi:hypothetical protein
MRKTYSELDLAECLLLVLVEVRKGNLDNPALQCIVGVFCATDVQA